MKKTVFEKIVEGTLPSNKILVMLCFPCRSSKNKWAHACNN